MLIYFAQDETGKHRKLSQPWHGPYRVISRRDPDIVASKIYFPDDASQKESISEVQSPVPDRSCPYYLRSRSKSRDKLSLGRK